MTTVLLASGGLDSSVVAAMAPCDIHLSIDYGQRHATRELASAKAIANWYLAEHVVLSVPGLNGLLPSALTGAGGDLRGAPTVVPNRNAILVSIAVGLVQGRGGGVVLIGVNADDYADYADCRPEFIAVVNTLALSATQGRVTVEAPLLTHTKPDIGSEANRLGVPVDLTWSCYAGGLTPCNECGACEQRGRALCTPSRSGSSSPPRIA